MLGRWLIGQQTEAHPNCSPCKIASAFSVNRRRLQAADLIGKIAERNEDGTKKKKRLAWNRTHHHQTTKNWKKALRADESKCKIFGSSYKIFVPSWISKRMTLKCVKSTVKHRGRSVMIWGCSVESLASVFYSVKEYPEPTWLPRHYAMPPNPSGMQLLSWGFIM